MNRVTGTIVLVQEERFQLDCDDGRKRLFVLSHDAPLESDELVALKGSRVEVEYDEQPDILAHTAHRLRQERPNEIQVSH
jgi:translation initiation factor IF-1